MKRVILIFSALISAAFAREPTKDDDIIFQLISISENADLNTDLLGDIADSGDEMSKAISSLFRPIKGEDKVYFFRAAFWGIGKFQEQPQIFHDLLILLVSQEGLILDGFAHTEEWGEMPLFYDLQRVSVKGLKLSSLKSVSELKLAPAIQGIGDMASFSRGVVDIKPRITTQVSTDANK